MIEYGKWVIESISVFPLLYTLRFRDSGPIGFDLVWRRSDDFVCSYYTSAKWSGCTPVPDDQFHASKLGITPAEHRFQHELLHHLVGIFVYDHFAGSPIIYRDAHHIAQPKGELVGKCKGTGKVVVAPELIEAYEWGPWQEEEWLVTALTYRLHGNNENDYGASLWLSEKGIDQTKILETARLLLPNPKAK